MLSALEKIVNGQTNGVFSKTRSHQPVLYLPNDTDRNQIWISATEFDNFCNKDKFCDWLNALKTYYKIDEEKEETTSLFLKYLFKKGQEYEEKVVNVLREQLHLPLEKQSTLQTSRQYVDDYTAHKDFSKVIECMQRGEPVIYSGFIYDQVNRLRGIPDLLVRNDFISNIFPTVSCNDNNSNISAFGNYYYLPVEIKFSSLHLNQEGKYFLNRDRLKIYKIQLYTYCKILESVQGYFPKKCFIIGKRTVHKGISYDPFVNTGIVDFEGFDMDIKEIFEEGYEWLCRVKTEFLNWNVFKMPEIFPNMKNDQPAYQSLKKKINEKINDITEIWQCSEKHRENAFKKGIYHWTDPRLSASILGVYQNHSATVDQLLRTNRGELGDFFPKAFTKNTHSFMQMRTEENEMFNEMFIDFETISQIDCEDSEIIFLIGTVYKGEYRTFLISQKTREEENRMLTEFYTYWIEQGSPKLWYWYAENEMWKRAVQRNPSIPIIPMFDLYEVYQQEPFTVRGCKNFKLKSYIHALHSLGKINAEFPPSCDNGLDAMLIAYEYYNEQNEDNERKFQDMIQYNRLDCVYLETLLNFARSL